MWINRLALVWGIVVFGCFIALGTSVNEHQVLKGMALLVALPWALLRGIYYVVTGHIRPRHGCDWG